MDEFEIRRMIVKCDLFDSLDQEERNELVRRTRVRGLHTGEILFHQGDDACAAFLVAKGQVKLSKSTAEGDQIIVALVTPGILFAVVALTQRTNYPVSAQAVVPSELLCWSKDDVGPIIDKHPEISSKAIGIISGRMFELQERYRELATLPVPQRLARTLLRLEEQRDDSGIAAFRLSRQDLADMIGSTIFTVSRILAAWHEAGAVDAARESVKVLDRARLERLSGLSE